MWFKLLLFFVIVFLVNTVLKFALRKWLKVKPRKMELFSSIYLNETHRKVDRFVRGITLIAGVAVVYFVILKENSITYMVIFGVFFVIMDYSVRAYFEWKASEQPKHAIFTLSEMVVWLGAITLLIQSSAFFFGLVEGVVTEKAEASFTVEVTSNTFWGGTSVEEVHLTDATIFKGKVATYEELEEGDQVSVIPFDLPPEFSYSLAAEVTVE